MYKQGKILFLKTETSVHPGAGSEVGIVDLPIQREAHTDFPIIRGSSLKGALRDYFWNVKGNEMKYESINSIAEKLENDKGKALLKIVFGPEPDEKGDDFSSSISLTDSRILFFPVKSLKKVFAYITCPMVLRRFNEDLKKINENGIDEFIENVKDIADGKAIVLSSELLEERYVVLEEYSFEVENGNILSDKPLSHIIEQIFDENDFRKNKLLKHLVILSDDDFKDFVLHSTEIVPRIKIDKEKGTVQGGALWYEENIPTDTVFYSLVLFSDAKKSKHLKDKIEAKELLKAFEENIPQIFQLGGNETVGRGLISTKLYPDCKNKKDDEPQEVKNEG